MKKKIIIFDFDGTLADTLDIVVKIANRMSSEFGYRKIRHEDVPRVRQESPFQIMREFHISPFKVHAILIRGRREFAKELKGVKTIQGMQKILMTLKEKGHTVGILTTNSKDNIEKFLVHNGLSEIFDFIKGDIGIFGKKKGLRGVLKERGLKREEVAYVGDEIRDIAAARAAGVTSVAVSWGFNNHDFLAAHKPDYLVDDPAKLQGVIQKII